MRTAEAIAKEVFYPYLEQDPVFVREPVNFWELVVKALSGYEQDPKPVFAAIYRLHLFDSEKIIERLPVIYDRFLENLAEQYVLGNISTVFKYSKLLESRELQEKIGFFKDLKSAVAKVEREHFIRELPAAYAALSGEIPDEEIRAAIVKKEREDLREKFAMWDREMEEEEREIVFDDIVHNINYSYSFPKHKEEEKEENLFLPEEPMPVRKSAPSYLWLIIIVIFLVLLLLWVLL